MIGRNFFEAEPLPFEKMVLVRFEPRTFDVPGVFATTSVSVQETIQIMNSLWTKAPAQWGPVDKVVYEKSRLVSICNTLAIAA